MLSGDAYDSPCDRLIPCTTYVLSYDHRSEERARLHTSPLSCPAPHLPLQGTVTWHAPPLTTARLGAMASSASRPETSSTDDRVLSPVSLCSLRSMEHVSLLPTVRAQVDAQSWTNGRTQWVVIPPGALPVPLPQNQALRVSYGGSSSTDRETQRSLPS